MVAVPETGGVHWKTRSGEAPELPQLPSNVLVPLVVPLKVPPAAGIGVALAQAAVALVSVVVVVEVLVGVVVVGDAAGGVTVRLRVPCAPLKTSPTMESVW